MLLNNLKQIVKEGKKTRRSVEYIRIQLKEMLIYYSLNFIYNSAKWSELIFGGGTALRVLKKTTRLSEDLDMDYEKGKSVKSDVLAGEIVGYYKQSGISSLQYALKQGGSIILLKFPILYNLGLAENKKSDTDYLYVKIELVENIYPSFKTESSPVMQDNLFFIVRHYDFPTLFANKIGAVMGRNEKLYLDQYDFRGRDFYDLIWFLENGFQPNLARVKEILKAEQEVRITSYRELWLLIEKRIKGINTKGIYDDLKNIIPGEESVKKLADNYLEIYKKLVRNLDINQTQRNNEAN